MSQPTGTSWNLGRFFDTVNYFDVIPFFSCLQTLFGGGQPKTPPQAKLMRVGVIGGTSNLSQAIISQLSAKNYQLKALVTEIPHPLPNLGGAVDWVKIDWAQPETLIPHLKGLDVIIDSQETQYPLSYLLTQVKQYLAPGTKTLFDFSCPTADLKDTWGAVDDVVMGGVSESQIRLADNKAIFSGNVSTANNGGFASVRTRNFNPPWNLSEYQGFLLTLKGDGKRYKFISRCEEKWDGMSYCYSFDTVDGIQQTITIPFKDLTATRRAKTIPEAASFDTSRVYSLQFMLSKFEYDGGLNPYFSPGLFVLEIETIKVYGRQQKPQFILIGDNYQETLSNSGVSYAIVQDNDSQAIAQRCCEILA